MAISRFSTSSVAQGLPKYQKLWDGTSVILNPAMESISTQTVGAGGAASITFSSIPQTYKHLQIRGIAHGTTAGDQDLKITLGNGTVSGTGYNWKNFYGNGSTVNTASGGSGANYMIGAWNFAINSGTGDIFSSIIVDIFDYQNTNKKKPIRVLAGVDKNGSGQVGMYSGMWYEENTALNIITFYPESGSFSQYTQFALYGIKG